MKIIIRLFIVAGLVLIPVLIFADDTTTVFVHPGSNYAVWAFMLGGLSAISLPLGSLLGLTWKPSPKITAVFTAFGGGALLAALSIELVAPTVMMVVGQGHSGDLISSDHAVTKMVSLIIGCMAGGLFFFFLNEALNSRGGYLRKVSTLITHLNHKKRDRYKLIFRKLGRIRFFRQIPKEQVYNLIKYLRLDNYHPQEVFFKEGEMAEGLYFIESGEVQLSANGKVLKTLKSGDIMGEISLLYHVPSKVTAVARNKVRAFELLNSDFDIIREQVPVIEKLALEYADKELNEVSHFLEDQQHSEAKEWSDHAIDHLHHSFETPTHQEIKEGLKEKSGSAPLAIWLGIFLDGIPESFVIGAGFLIILVSKISVGNPTFSEVVPYTLIAGLFLSNFPEAMSSSIGMRNIGWKWGKILILWSSLMVMTAVGAVFGFYFSKAIPETLMIGVEGLAAGAMLTMVAQTMIPEAVHIGGHKVVGLGTLAGYLSAIAFKIFE
jgi:zinc transporter ZupT